MKNHTFLLLIVLEMCQKMNGQRSKMGIVNILYGKRNHQTWSDIHLFQLQQYYRYLFREDKELIQDAFNELLQLGYIERFDNEVIRVTHTGELYINKIHTRSHRFLRDGRIVFAMEQYWSFLHLLVQTVSNLLYNQRNFLPVIRNATIQARVKRWITDHGVNNGAKGLVQELITILEALPEQFRKVLVLRLSGNHRIGWTTEQLSKMNKITYLEAKWQWESLLCELYSIIMKTKLHYLPKVQQESDLLVSQSCKETWNLLQNDLSIADISQIRKLKESTVMDHIVELALIDVHMDYSKYISKDDIKKIDELFSQIGSKRLKMYKEQYPTLSYFQIRLALAIISRGKTNENESIFN